MKIHMTTSHLAIPLLSFLIIKMMPSLNPAIDIPTVMAIYVTNILIVMTLKADKYSLHYPRNQRSPSSLNKQLL